jgi:hypothetical protein
LIQLVLREKYRTSTRMITVGRSLQPVYLTQLQTWQRVY